MIDVRVYPIKPVFTDARGEIMDLIEEQVGHVGMITSVKGAVRANHYHKQSAQYTYVVSGVLELKTRPAEGGEVRVDILRPGDMAVIPPLVIHAVTALEDAVFLDATTLSRGAEGYEADTVRVPAL